MRTQPWSPSALAALACALSGGARAADFDALQSLGQAEFRAFSEDIAAAVSYKPMIPSESLGITGFDLGFSVGATSLAHRAVLVKAAGGASVPKAVPLVALRATKGLPLDLDIGVAVVNLPGTNVRATGGELRWAVIGGDALVPAVALRVSASNLAGVDRLHMRTQGADISISKGFAFATPYAGAGYVHVRSSAPGTALAQEQFNLRKAYAGVNLAFSPLAVLLEADRTGSANSYGVKLALRW
jgi:hypothetical protein